MPISYIGETSTTDLIAGSSTTSLVATIPASTAVGDLMLMWLFTNNAQTVTAPAGWTNVLTYTGYGTLYHRCMYRVAVSGDTSWTWTQSAGDLWSVMVQTYRGASPDGIVTCTQGQNGATTTITATSSITVPTSGMTIVVGCLDMTSTHTITGTGYTATTQITRAYKQQRHLYKAGTGSADTPSITFTTAASGRSCGLMGIGIRELSNTGLFFGTNL